MPIEEREGFLVDPKKMKFQTFEQALEDALRWTPVRCRIFIDKDSRLPFRELKYRDSEGKEHTSVTLL